MSELIAHRGYPAHYPENSLVGIQAAASAGARYVEVDVQLSRDAVPVLFHDRDLQRLCHQHGALHEYDWDQLQEFTLHADSKLPVLEAETSLSSLGDLTTLMKALSNIHFFVELKRAAIEQFGAEAVLDVVLPVLAPVMQQCCLISYDFPILHRLKIRQDAQVGVIIDEWAMRTEPAIRILQPEYLFCNLASFPATGDLSLDAARLVAFETVDPVEARGLMQRGVDLVETDAIGELQQALAEAND